MARTAQPDTTGENGGKKPVKARRASRRKGHQAHAAIVNKLLQSIEAKIDAKELKATLGDFIRLLQLQRELEEEQPREIKVTWVEPAAARLSET